MHVSTFTGTTTRLPVNTGLHRTVTFRAACASDLTPYFDVPNTRRSTIVVAFVDAGKLAGLHNFNDELCDQFAW
jgi:hypothetical protein